MNCGAAAPLLAAHGDNALNAIDRAAVRAHLESCEDCRSLAEKLRDKIGRLEAVLAGYRVRAAAVDQHVDTARAALGGRLSTVDYTPLWIGVVLLGPAVLAAIIAGSFAALGWEAWWWTDHDDLPAVALWMAGAIVPGLAAVLLATGWRRMRREAGHEVPEGILLAITAGMAALLAWWPFAGLLAEAGASVGRWAGGRGTQAQLVYVHLALGVLALAVAVLVTGPMIMRPAPAPARDGTGGNEPARRAVRARLEDALRLLALACFERGGDLLDAARVAEDEVAIVAARIREAEGPDGALRRLAQEIAADAIEESSPSAPRSTLKLRKVAERRELESALHAMGPDVRPVAYLRLVTQVPLTRVQRLLAVDAATTARGLAAGLEQLGRFARSPSEEGGSGFSEA